MEWMIVGLIGVGIGVLIMGTIGWFAVRAIARSYGVTFDENN